MNTALTFLHQNWTRLDLGDFGRPDQFTCVIKTPRFRASSHVVFLCLRDHESRPALVVKMPRLKDGSDGMTHEAANLLAIQASRPGGFDSIPRVIAFEPYADRAILVETALAGPPMDPRAIRQTPEACCDAVVDWLIDVQQPSKTPTAADPGWFQRLIEQPLSHFVDVFPMSLAEEQLVVQTLTLAASLRQISLPLVFEHGDLSHPNILRLKNGHVGVVDWELAEPHGLPAYDLFFFLTYATFALHNANANRQYESAFHAAFFRPTGWAQPYIRRYWEALQLAPAMFRPLFVVCWARYTANLLIRLNACGGAGTKIDADTAAWLRSNRYYRLWQYTAHHRDALITGA